MKRRLAAVVALAVATRLVYLGFANTRLTDDEVSFWTIAGNVIHGRGYSYQGAPTAWRPPLYTYALAILRELGLGVAGVQVVQAFLGAATPVLLYFIARRLRLPDWAAWLAAVIGALYPAFVFLPSQIWSENASIPMLLLAVWATLVIIDRPAIPAAIGAGVAWGGAALARPAALAGLLVAVPAVAVVQRADRRRLGAAGVVGVAAVATLVPWVVRDARDVGGPLPVVSNEGLTLWAANRSDTSALKNVFRDPRYPGLQDYSVFGRAFPGIKAKASADGFDFEHASEAARDRWFRGLVRRDVEHDPLRFAKRSALKVVASLAPAPSHRSQEEKASTLARLGLWLTSGSIIVLGLIGFAGLLLRGDGRWRFVVITALLALVGMAVHLPYVRYRVGAVDPFLILASCWVIAVATDSQTSSNRNSQARNATATAVASPSP
jgi:hypothetical protein